MQTMELAQKSQGKITWPLRWYREINAEFTVQCITMHCIPQYSLINFEHNCFWANSHGNKQFDAHSTQLLLVELHCEKERLWRCWNKNSSVCFIDKKLVVFLWQF